ncbi:glycosyltransferase [Caulobacter sp. S45]|uniref:glycosyltransferase n=1 Tax=Caulobacter sp. S45 TaxID=1641861 RepID=UPI001575E1C6|nr:glycosyltransferase [Caulobacter sp. S45]
MKAALKHAYGRLRTVPVAGLMASRTVWALKGALGKPVAVPAATCVPPPATPDRRRVRLPVDIRLKVTLAALQALTERLARLEPASSRATALPPGVAGAPQNVSVIVSTLDRAPWLDRALSALAMQRHPSFEVIVVPGPCRDETAEVLARHAGRIRVSACGQANLSASRNQGLRLARGEIVAFLDDDAVPEPDWLERITRPYTDPQVGGVGGYIRDHTGLAYQCKVVVADRLGRSQDVGDLRRARLDPPAPDIGRYLSLTGTNSSFRRDALLGVGGFDEAYAYFLDETDVCLRLAEASWRLTIAADAEVHHAYAPSAQRRADRAPVSLIACARSTAYFAWRNALADQGLEAVVQHLQAYVEGLQRDTRWRRDHGVISARQADRFLAEIDAGLVEGVRMAAGGPRRLLQGLEARPTGVAWGPGAPVLRPAAERLKLCLLSQDYPSNASEAPCGGVAVWTHALANAMAAEGHEVSVVTRARSAEPSVGLEVAAGHGVWVHRIADRPTKRLPGCPGVTTGLPASVAQPALAAAEEVARMASRRRFDLVLGPLWDLEAAALVGGPWPVAVSLHTACAQMAGFKPGWSDAYRRTHVDRVVAGERRLLAGAVHVLANSRAAACDIGAALDLPDLACRAVVVPHGLPDLAQGVRPAARGGGVEILFVGRLERRKGVDVLLEAVPAVLQQAPSARLTVVGEDVSGEEPWREAFLQRHGGASWLGRVRFEGPLPRAALLRRYAACDVVTVPSRYESFGLTALESMIFAKPCVAGDAGGLREVVAEGDTGLLTPPGDPAALVAALLRLVRDPGLRRAMGEAGRRRYEARFTDQAMARSVEAWMRGVIAGSRQMAAE